MDTPKTEHQGTSHPAALQPEPPAESQPSSERDGFIDFQMSSDGLGLMGQRQQVRDAVDLIKTAVDGSPTGVAIVGVRGANQKEGFGQFDFQNREPFDHVLIAYRHYNEKEDKYEYRIAEMMPGDAPDPDNNWSRLFGSPSEPGTIESTGRTWHSFVAVPLTLTAEQDALLRASVIKNLSGGNIYSFLSEQGHTCASGARQTLIDARVWDWTEKGLLAELESLGFNIVQPGTVVEWGAQRSGVIYDSHIYTRTPSPDSPDGGHAMEGVEKQVEKESYINLKGALQEIWERFREHFPDAADAFAERLLEFLEREPSWLGAAADVNMGMPDVLVPKSVVEKALQGMWEDFCEAYPEAAKALAKTLVTHHDPTATDDWVSWTTQVMVAIPDILDKFAQPAAPAPTSADNQGASHSDEVAIATDTEDALSDDDASRQPATDDGEDASPEQVAIAADTKHAPGDDDASRRPATDADQDASQEQVARALDDEDAPTDDAAAQRPTDDEDEASQEDVTIASRPEDAPSDNVEVVKPASVEAVIAQILGDQAGPATSAPVTPDDGFSFSAFPRPVTPADVVKEVMPAGQLLQEDISGSGTPESESALPDAGSEDVGNAAPSKDHVVHHGDLAP